MPLATLSQVKAKLQIPANDTEEDAAIQAVLDAAEQFVLAQTGFVLADTSVEEFFQQAQIGRTIYLRHRPVSGVTAAVRSIGDGAWHPVAVDVIDATSGMIALPGEAAWPPQAPSPRWLAWRAFTWDILKVVYIAVALSPVPADLSDATALLGAYWYLQHLAGPATDVAVGSVRESYERLPMPPAVDMVLARYERGIMTWW